MHDQNAVLQVMLDQYAVRTLQLILRYATHLDKLGLLTDEDNIVHQTNSSGCCGDPSSEPENIRVHDLVSRSW